MYYLTKKVMMLCLIISIAGCASGGKEKESQNFQYSGYLGNYTGLALTKNANGLDVLRWVNPELKKRKYQKLILDPVVIYPKPRPGPHVSIQAIKSVVAYTNMAMRRAASKEIELVDRPGPGTLRMRIAFTGVKTDKVKMSGFEFTPIGLLFVGVQEATGTRNEDAFIMFEGEFIDTATGDVMAKGVIKEPVKAVVLKSQDQPLTLDMVRPTIDENAVLLQKVIRKIMK